MEESGWGVGGQEEGEGGEPPHTLCLDNPSSESEFQNPEQLRETLRMRDRGGGNEVMAVLGQCQEQPNPWILRSHLQGEKTGWP